MTIGLTSSSPRKPRATGSLLPLFALAAGCISLASAAEFHVTPSGSPAGNGSLSSPWNLSTALAHPSTVQPGDTIWLRSGTYTGAFTSTLRGTSSAPIIVRAYPGERVTIDGVPSAQTTLSLNGEHTWYWGFEITNSSTAPRVTNVSNFDLRPYALASMGPNLKLINLVIHDAGNGIGLWNTSVDTEVYGCYVYYNGWTDPNRGHGEGIYMQNSTGTKRLIDNVLFNQFDSGIMAYGSSSAKVDNVYYEGNVLFANGRLTAEPNGWGFLIGGGSIANNHSLVSNYVYNTFDYKRSNNMDIAYGQGSNNTTMTGNYSAGYAAINYEKTASNLTATGNTFIGFASTNAVSQISAATNTFLSSPPASSRIFVRRNRYDNTRAMVIVYNWAGSTNVSADLNGLLASGDRYEVRKIENYFADPVVSGTYSSGAVTLPMTNFTVAPPVGSVPNYPVTTFPTFGVFEVRKIASAPEPEPPVPSAFTVRLEAESATLASPMASYPDAGASGGRFIASSRMQLGLATFNFSVPASKTYAVWVRVRANSYASDSFFVSADGSLEKIFELSMRREATEWQWVNLNSREIGSRGLATNPWHLQLNNGQHSLRFRAREANTHLDQILITDDLEFIPEAETAENQSISRK